MNDQRVYRNLLFLLRIAFIPQRNATSSEGRSRGQWPGRMAFNRRHQSCVRKRRRAKMRSNDPLLTRERPRWPFPVESQTPESMITTE
jgi:hypothetical protein